MNDTRKQDDIHNSDDAVARLAPHLDEQWRDDFTLELRMLDVPGDVIGDALVTADTHVAESGETAQEAFGDAKAYARETAAATPTKTVGMGIPPASWVGIVAGLVGMLTTLSAVTAWASGSPVEITVGNLVVGGMLTVLVIATMLWSERILRFAVDHRTPFAIFAPIVFLALFVPPLVLLRQEVATVSPGVYAIGGAVLLAASAWLSCSGLDIDNDEIAPPGHPGGPASVGMRLMVALMFPVMTLVLGVFFWMLERFLA